MHMMTWHILGFKTPEVLQPGTPTVDRISPEVLRGVSHEGRLIGRDACNREQEGNRDTRVR